MARIARIVVPGYFHHVSQWGNRTQNVFFCDEDRKYYLKLLEECVKEAGIKLYAYCLMDNHVHLIVVPEKKESFSEGIGKLHRQYTNTINSRQGWRGHLWQGRFASYPFDATYIADLTRFVERTPVRRGIVKCALDYPWSSASARVQNVNGCNLGIVEEIENQDWTKFLAKPDVISMKSRIKQHCATGRPLGDSCFIQTIEALIGRNFAKKKPGPKKIG
jgi:putative transposase